MENVAGEQGLDLQQRFDTNLLTLFKIQTVIKPQSLMPEAWNLAILMFSTCFSIFGILEITNHNIIKRRPSDGLAAKGLLAHPQTKQPKGLGAELEKQTCQRHQYC